MPEIEMIFHGLMKQKQFAKNPRIPRTIILNAGIFNIINFSIVKEVQLNVIAFALIAATIRQLFLKITMSHSE